MVVNIVSVVVLVALVVLFAWLTKRAWGSRHKILKWPALILAALLTLVLALATVVALVGFYKTSAPQSNPVASVKVAGTPDQIARGAKFAILCAGCHSSTNQPPLDGGTMNFAAIPGGPPLGTIYPPNLTPAGEIKDWSDGEILRAIREGVHKSGRAMLVMPSDQFHNMSDSDVQSVIAYLRSQPAEQRNANVDTPANGVNVLGAIFVGSGLFNTSAQAPITQPVVAPPEGVTADYGKYLVSISACRDCHGQDLAGGTPGGFAPVGPNLTILVPKWSDADFVKTIRTGVDPTGKQLNPDEMPWKGFSAMYSDDELKAIYTYLHGLAPITRTAQ